MTLKSAVRANDIRDMKHFRQGRRRRLTHVLNGVSESPAQGHVCGREARRLGGGQQPSQGCGTLGAARPGPPLALRSRAGSGRRGRAALPEPPSRFSASRGHSRARGPRAARPQKPSPLAGSRTLLPEQRRHSLIGIGACAPDKESSSDWLSRYEAEAQSGVFCPGTRSWSMAEPELEPRQARPCSPLSGRRDQRGSLAEGPPAPISGGGEAIVRCHAGQPDCTSRGSWSSHRGVLSSSLAQTPRTLPPHPRHLASPPVPSTPNDWSTLLSRSLLDAHLFCSSSKERLLFFQPLHVCPQSHPPPPPPPPPNGLLRDFIA
ncbi:formin-like protein 1 [Felis catus]|uniref:formin-like protein 1 n=1 Tax=Felis catus TaxID=9685 RepID=UPI001D1A1E4A|nr:formin-like protein 1 [Felis catus]